MALILGLTGSIGSGKSFVSEVMSRYGAIVISADALAREIVAPGTPAYQEILQAFGKEVLREDRTLDRARIGKIVFHDPGKRKELEKIIHPRVRQRELELIERYHDHPLIVVEVPLLFEAGLHKHCDRTVAVTISEKAREERLSRSRGMTPGQIQAVLKAQMPQEEKARRADFVIDNSGPKRKTEELVSKLLHTLFPTGLPHPLISQPEFSEP